MRRFTTINAPSGATYLKDFMPDEGLPKNCLFDKVLTGCGGTYLALTSPEPYIIAVPTKALVHDKVTSPTYKDINLQGVSQDYPIGSRCMANYDKIIVTYKSLPRVCERLCLDRYNLLVDEVHMLANMSGYAKDELLWIMANFKNFKSYCFMSATIPRAEHLLTELQDIPLVQVSWPDVAKVSFNCLQSSNIQQSLIAIMLEHKRRRRVGVPYFFYNSVVGVCALIKRWNYSGKYPATFNVVCARTPENRSKLKSVGLDFGTPNAKADFHFITATAFEGVDFYNPRGRTYIISDKSYVSTKYSIETTIPQIIGRLRDSKHNNEVTVIFNRHEPVTSMTPREFSLFIEKRELEAKETIELYNSLKEEYKTNEAKGLSLKSLMGTLMENPHAHIVGGSEEYEDLLFTHDPAEGEYPDFILYPYAKIMAQQTYDLFHDNHYVTGEEVSKVKPLSEVSGEAPVLTEDELKLFRLQRDGLKPICDLYKKDPKTCEADHPEWFDLIQDLGLDVCKAYGYKKKDLKTLHKAHKQAKTDKVSEDIYRTFSIGDVYTADKIKEILKGLGVERPKGTTLNKWFITKRVVRKGVSCYRIIQRVDDILD